MHDYTQSRSWAQHLTALPLLANGQPKSDNFKHHKFTDKKQSLFIMIEAGAAQSSTQQQPDFCEAWEVCAACPACETAELKPTAAAGVAEII